MSGQQQRMLIDHYILDKTLGSGGFGKVKLAIHEYTGSKVAIKIITKKLIKSQKISSKIQREIRLMKYFNHPNIIKLYQVLDTAQNIFVVMEYVSGGELFELVNDSRGFDEATSRRYFRQIIDGVEYCHQNLVSHRDLKLENILVDEKGVIKIADFGLSNFMKDGQFLRTSCGSLHYASPEIVKGIQYTGAEIDIWSCGVILYAMLTGSLPFEDESKAVIVEKITKGAYMIPSQVSPLARDLVAKMLKVNPVERISIQEIKRHPWFVNTDQSAFVLKDYSNKEESQKVNDFVLGKLLELDGFDYKGLQVDEIREAIKLKKNYSFVVGYELLHKDYMKDITTVESHQNQVFFGPIKNYLDTHQQELYSHYENMLSDSYPIDWQYGVKLPYSVEDSFKKLIQVFIEANIPHNIKSSSYHVKCNYNPNGDSMSSNEMLEEIETQDSSNIQFSVQLYQINPKLHLVDFKRTSGNSLVFLDLCSKLRHKLQKK